MIVNTVVQGGGGKEFVTGIFDIRVPTYYVGENGPQLSHVSDINVPLKVEKGSLLVTDGELRSYSGGLESLNSSNTAFKVTGDFELNGSGAWG